VDVGGSGSRYVLLAGDGSVIGKGDLSWKWGDELEALRSEIETLGVGKVAVAMRGVWRKDEREKVRRILGVSTVMADFEGAFYDVFSDEGMVVVAGTGSVCYGERDGKKVRFGGFGPLVDDWGSAFWIGRLATEIALKKESFLRLALFGSENLEAIRDQLAEIHRLSLPEAVRRIASLSPKVLEAAEVGDTDALFVVRAALRELLGMCIRVSEELGGLKTLALHGGLFKSSFFTAEFKKLFKRYAFVIVEGTDAARGAARKLLRS